jgi:hypothetical protein
MLKPIVMAITLSVSLLAAESTEAAPISVKCLYGDGSPCFSSNGTWYIPAIGENEPGAEEAMQISFPGFTYTSLFTSAGRLISRPTGDLGGFFNVLDPNGEVSDVVDVFPLESPVVPGDNRIVIRSDPNAMPISGFAFLGTLATETDTGGAIGFVQFLGPPDVLLDITMGFDGEFVYGDAFGVGVDTSDDALAGCFVGDCNIVLGEKGPPFVNNRIEVEVPEPSSLGVLAFALAALGILLQGKMRSALLSRQPFSLDITEPARMIGVEALG